MLRRHAGERGSDAAQGWTHYQMRQNLISLGDDFWIENEYGQRILRVDGKAMRVRHALAFEDANGHELCRIREEMLRDQRQHGN